MKIYLKRLTISFEENVPFLSFIYDPYFKIAKLFQIECK